MPFEKSAQHPEAMIKILLKLMEKTPTGGATLNDLLDAYADAKGDIPDEKSIQRIVRRINILFDPEFGNGKSGNPPAIEVKRENGERRYRLTRELAPDKRIDSSQAILFALSLYPQQRQMVSEQFEMVMKMVFEHTLQKISQWYQLQSEMEKYVFVSGGSPANARHGGQIIFQTMDAIRRSKQVRFHYTRTYDGETVKSREVDPYGLLCRQGTWYLVGYCHESSGRRIFRLDQIDRFSLLENKVSRIPADFSLKQAYGNAWGTWTDDDDTTLEKVRLRVKPRLAKKFEVNNFHPSQTFSPLPDGSAEISYRVTGAQEMVPWLLTWAETIEVLEPQWLREEMIASAKEIVKVYEDA